MHAKRPEGASLASRLGRRSYEKLQRGRGTLRSCELTLIRKAFAVGAGILIINALSFYDARAQELKAARNATYGGPPQKTARTRRRAARKPPPSPCSPAKSSMCGPDIPLPTNIREVYDPATVLVQVAVDEQGRVTSAQAITGDPSLRQRAVDAALSKRFPPKIMSGRPVKVAALLTYKFDISTKPAKGPYEYDPSGRESSAERGVPD